MKEIIIGIDTEIRIIKIIKILASEEILGIIIMRTEIR